MTPLRLLMSAAAAARHRSSIAAVLGSTPHVLVEPQTCTDADIAFVSRDVTGLSTKHRVLPDTQAFYDALLRAASLRWVHIHSAGTDRPVFVTLQQRGVVVTPSSGANAAVVAQTALAGLLALARRFPQLMRAQRSHVWAPLIGGHLPRDLEGQTVVVVGWGPIARTFATLVRALNMRVVVVRSTALAAGAGLETLAFEDIGTALPRADWLVLACPLSDRTRNLIDARALGLLPAGAHLLNVSRGEVVDEVALIQALQTERLSGAFLDVFSHEPLTADSSLWDLPNVICTPHSAGFSDGNEDRVASMFLEKLAHWRTQGPAADAQQARHAMAEGGSVELP